MARVRLIGVPELSQRLGMRYRSTWERVLGGEFGTVTREAGRLFVDAAEVERRLAEQGGRPAAVRTR